MPEVVFPLDSTKKFTDQEKLGHNRWHPDIPAAVTVKKGDSFRVHCREWFDGAIVNDDSADDILNAPLTTVHVLSGPIAVEGAKPGDLLIVDILDVGPIPQEDSGPLAGQGWGYTGIFPKLNGGGFLTDQFPDAYKAIWDFSGQKATSRHVPHVEFTGIVHPGLMGTAPSTGLLAKWNTREAALIATDPDRVPPLALPPEPQDAILGGDGPDPLTRPGRRRHDSSQVLHRGGACERVRVRVDVPGPVPKPGPPRRSSVLVRSRATGRAQGPIAPRRVPALRCRSPDVFCSHSTHPSPLYVVHESVTSPSVTTRKRAKCSASSPAFAWRNQTRSPRRSSSVPGP